VYHVSPRGGGSSTLQVLYRFLGMALLSVYALHQNAHCLLHDLGQHDRRGRSSPGGGGQVKRNLGSTRLGLGFRVGPNSMLRLVATIPVESRTSPLTHGTPRPAHDLAMAFFCKSQDSPLPPLDAHRAFFLGRRMLGQEKKHLRSQPFEILQIGNDIIENTVSIAVLCLLDSCSLMLSTRC